MLAAGLALSALMVVRCQLGGDQLNLLARGWRLAAQGELVPYGNPLSGGGVEPGAVTSLLVGLPLVAWSDHRAPVVAIFLAHLLAYGLLDRVVREALSARERWLFATLYWLDPWRVYFSAFLWNPNWLFLAGAVHLWTVWRQRAAGRFWPSFSHALALGLALQLHPSAALLVLASAFLLWRGRFRVNGWGILAGAVVAGATLLPFLLELGRDPRLWERREGFVGHGLLTGVSLLRGAGYWLRYPSACFSRKMVRFDWTPLLGARADALLGPAFFGLAAVACALTIVPSLLGNLQLARRCRLSRRRLAAAASGRAWLRGYVQWTACGALVGFGLAPTTVMSWQALIVLHAAVLPAVWWWHGFLGHHPRPLRRRLVGAQAGLALVFSLAMALASPQYRCGGRHELRFPLHADHPMLHELGVHRTCPWPIDPAHPWWPDALTE